MLKDEVLERLASQGANVAQFVSYDPSGAARFMRIRGVGPVSAFASIEDAVRAIHATQSEPNVNIRTFLPDKPDGNPFFSGPKCGFNDPQKAAEKAREMCAKGYHIIVNETIDEADGGFSGVLFGNVFEFASRDIPRCVDRPNSGCAALSRDLARRLISQVYGFDFQLPYSSEFRVECSVHPLPVGYLGQHQVVWQAERMDSPPSAPPLRWPNRYSRDMGDKAFGLLIAHLLDFPVPYTYVFGRVIPLFEFGDRTWSGDMWVRTCPSEQMPGKFTTKRGWLDPFALMQKEDPEGKLISALLIQDGIRAEYSGAVITQSDGSFLIEGVSGHGDSFMVGQVIGSIPLSVEYGVRSLARELRKYLGDVRFEWVHDGKKVWIVQLHVGASPSQGDIIYPGEPETFIAFDVALGLEALRETIAEAEKNGTGIVLKGNVGITSHFGDVLRRSKIPSRIERT